MSYIAAGDAIEDAYAAESPEEFRRRCAGYGFTAASHGTSWDDRCIGHESQDKLGPFAPPEGEAAASTPSSPSVNWPLVGAVGLAAVTLLVLVRR